MAKIPGDGDVAKRGKADLSTRARLATYPNAKLLAMLGDARDEPEGELTSRQIWGFARKAFAAEILAERGLEVRILGPGGRSEPASCVLIRRYTDASAPLVDLIVRLMGAGPVTSEPESKKKKKGRRPR